jgi:hypothetical protein
MSVGTIVGRVRSLGRAQVASMTSGQRWTSTLAIGLAVVMLLAGMPSNIRVIAAPPTAQLPPIVIAQPPAPPIPFIPPAPVVLPSVAPPPEEIEPPKPEPEFTPPPPGVHACLTDEMIGVPVFAQLAEQLRPIQAQYEAATGQPLGVDLVSVALVLGQCTDALPNVPALVTISVLLNEVYDALEAAGVPPIDLPEPPVVDIPDVPAPLRPVLSALAPVVLPACTGVPFFGVTVGIGGAFGLLPVADGLLPVPTSEILPYMWPVRALCRLLTQYAPPPEPAAAEISSGGLAAKS